MAKAQKTFKIDEGKKVIIVYSNLNQTEEDDIIIQKYAKYGYTIQLKEKKKAETVSEMRAKLELEDKAALDEFNRLYAIKKDKNDEESKSGFHLACKFYTDWKKDNKKKKESK